MSLNKTTENMQPLGACELRELQAIAEVYKDHKPQLSDYFTQSNIDWIDNVIQAVIFSRREICAMPETALYAYLLTVETEPIEFTTPKSLHRHLIHELERLYSLTPSMVNNMINALDLLIRSTKGASIDIDTVRDYAYDIAQELRAY